MSIEIVTKSLKTITNDGDVVNLEGTLRAYLHTQTAVGVIYDFWLSTSGGKIEARVKEHSTAEFITIPLRDKAAA